MFIFIRNYINNAQWRRESIDISGEVRVMWSAICKLENLHVFLIFKQKLEEV